MKAHIEDWKRIYLLKTTHQRRDLEIQTAASFKYLALCAWSSHRNESMKERKKKQ